MTETLPLMPVVHGCRAIAACSGYLLYLMACMVHSLVSMFRHDSHLGSTLAWGMFYQADFEVKLQLSGQGRTTPTKMVANDIVRSLTRDIVQTLKPVNCAA